MSLKKILKEAQKLEREWLEQQRAKETKIPEDFVEFCLKFLKLKQFAINIQGKYSYGN